MTKASVWTGGHATTTVLRTVTLSPTPSVALKLAGEMVSANTAVDASATVDAARNWPNLRTEVNGLNILIFSNRGTMRTDDFPPAIGSKNRNANRTN